jgi:hypothetical protein
MGRPGAAPLVARTCEVTPTSSIRSAIKDILAGSTFVAFGVLFAAISMTYEIGTPVQMGPGLFPLALGGILAALGVLIVVKGFVAGEGDIIDIVPWRAVALIVAGVVFFGFTVRGLGLVPSLFVTTVLAALGGYRTRPVTAVVIAGGLTVLCVLIFVVGLQLRLPLIGSWIPV